MLKSWRKFPLYVKQISSVENYNTKFPLLENCRCFILSSYLEKKHKAKSTRSDDNDAERLKRESPFLFKVIKTSKHLDKDNPQHKKILRYEPPILFQPIKVKASELEDDLSHLGHHMKIHTAKKENVFIIQPNFKWGKEKKFSKLVDHRLAEAEALIKSVHTWDVLTTCIEPIQDINSKLFFGSGKVLELSEKIRKAINDDGITMVFLNTGKLSLRQSKELEGIWGCKVFDRYRVVLELFKERANTKEAKLQVQLAEIQYMRTHLTSEDYHYDQQRGGGKGMAGGGETQIEKSKRMLAQSEIKIKKELQLMKVRRKQLKADRIRKRVPQVAMVGYTNAGKTTLAKILSQDASMEGENKLFATLDTTAHRGKLPSGLNLVYIDTVGFISELPHDLVESFATTFEDVKTADLLVHVADCSHPEFELQMQTVENVLERVEMPENLMRNKITVLNKIDLGSRLATFEGKNNIPVSATNGAGIDELRRAIEEKILQSTGREPFRINLDIEGDELSWLYRNGTVLDTVFLENGSVDVVAILDAANKNKFEKMFQTKVMV